MWLEICQGLMLVFWAFRVILALLRVINGTEKTEPLGAGGVVIVDALAAFSAAITWRSGALSTILGSP